MKPVRVSALYPASESARFDFDYYADRHLPLVFRLMRTHGCRRIEADRGLSVGNGGAVYVAAGHMEFDSLESFNEGIAANGEAIMADVANYTDITPVLQVSEIAATVP